MLQVKPAIHKILRANWEIRVDECFFESFNAQAGNALGGQRSNKTNSSMPQFKQVFGRHSCNFRFQDPKRHDPLPCSASAEAGDRHVI
jgi:hypothetical protein